MNELTFTLPVALPSLNVRDGQHWATRARDKKKLMSEVLAALGGPRHFPRSPWRNVRVTVTRCSSGRLDQDNLYASFKPLGDALKTLNIIEDDRSDWLELIVTQFPAPKGAGYTLVRIELKDRDHA